MGRASVIIVVYMDLLAAWIVGGLRRGEKKDNVDPLSMGMILGRQEVGWYRIGGGSIYLLQCKSGSTSIDQCTACYRMIGCSPPRLPLSTRPSPTLTRYTLSLPPHRGGASISRPSSSDIASTNSAELGLHVLLICDNTFVPRAPLSLLAVMKRDYSPIR